ncbi:hypothetical protein EG329_006629 [Mollisiaceae sp. DMI_Dod_QoI]|nr:hypothetical protein EG329_006629 [Helotiales sp. DMI_Dod_QoI]
MGEDWPPDGATDQRAVLQQPPQVGVGQQNPEVTTTTRLGDNDPQYDQDIEEIKVLDVNDGRDRLMDLLQDRKSKYLKGTYETFGGQFRELVKRLMIDNPYESVLKTNDTLLDYVARTLSRNQFNVYLAYQLLVRLILEIAGDEKWQKEHDPKCHFLETQSSSKGTFLHTAISAMQIDFAKFVCRMAADYSLKDALARAIAVKNMQDDTCLHLAMAGHLPVMDLELIELLLDITPDSIIAEKRGREGRGSKEAGPGAGNTPVHDFVDIKRFNINTKKCTRHECTSCQNTSRPAFTQAWYRAKFMELLRRMVKRNPDVMFSLNRDEQSPYMYHISTRKADKREWKDSDFDPPPAPTPSNDGPNEVASMPQSLGKTSEMVNLRESQNDDRQPGGLKRRTTSKALDNSTTTENHSTKHQSAKPEYHEELAKEVTIFLLEQSLSMKDYLAACLSLFGNSLKTSESIFMADPLTMQTQDLHSKRVFGPILGYLELGLARSSLPTLPVSSTTNSSKPAAQPTGISEKEDVLKGFFKWLRGRNVKRIVKLIIVDDPYQPCRDKTIADCLQGFDVRYLEWNKDDIYIPPLKKHAGNLHELWVSWSGRGSALSGWLNPKEGIPTLKKARIIEEERPRSTNYNHPIASKPSRELEVDNQEMAYLSSFKDQLSSIEVSIPTDPIELDEFFGQDRAQDNNSGSIDSEHERTNMWLNAVESFNAKVSRCYEDIRKNVKSITVGLIDDGIELEKLGSPEAKGWSVNKMPPPHKGVNLWFRSKRGHGTAMADIILKMCPHVHFFAGKVDTGGVDQSEANSAADAINEARKAKVDIISMSWTTYASNTNPISELETAIGLAAKDDIILYCAGQDQGEHESEEIKDKPYPKSCATDRVKAIGSAGVFGAPSLQVMSSKVDYLFPGEIPPDLGLKSNETSSCATARAAGLAALILWCAEVHRLRTQAKAASSNSKHEAGTQGTKGAGTVKAANGIKKATDTEVEFYDFKKDGRMNDLFDKLRTGEKHSFASLVGVWSLLNDAANSDDPAGELVKRCWNKLGLGR